MGNGYLPAAPEKNAGPPTRQSAVCEEDLIYISICSGGVIIKISAADRPKFVLGQLIIFGAVVVVALVELTLLAGKLKPAQWSGGLRHATGRPSGLLEAPPSPPT